MIVDSDLHLAYKECGRITKKEAANFYYAFLTLPKNRRRAIYAVYAFCRYCDDAVDDQSSMDSKLESLDLLREKLGLSYAGQAVDPIFLCLGDVAKQFEIPQEYFEDVLLGVESDLVKNRYQNFEELKQYCYKVASVVGLICIQIFGYREDIAKTYAIDLGLAMQLTNILRDIQEDLLMDRIYLPKEETDRFNYSEEDLRSGLVNDQFKELMIFQTNRARKYFERGFLLSSYLSIRSRACPIALGGMYRTILERIERSNFDIFHNRITLTTAEKIRIMCIALIMSLVPNWARKLK